MLVSIRFFVNAAGNFEKLIDIEQVPINHYDSSTESEFSTRKSSASWLEFWFLVYTLYETYKLISMLLSEWRFMTELEEPLKIKPTDSCLKKLAIRLGI